MAKAKSYVMRNGKIALLGNQGRKQMATNFKIQFFAIKGDEEREISLAEARKLERSGEYEHDSIRIHELRFLTPGETFRMNLIYVPPEKRELRARL